MKNMVDERFECIALIFRLSGDKPEYAELETDFQREVAETFAEFAEHPAVKLAKTFDGSNGVWVGYDAVVKFAVHIEKKDNHFFFIDDINSMFDSGRWNETAAQEFLPLFNHFYTDTNYAEFFNSHTELFEQYTQKFIDEVYEKIDFEWFRKYVDPSNLRCIYSPSVTIHNYGSTVNDKIIYCVVTETSSSLSVVHEYCHSFGNPLAYKWYQENETFKKWCDDSINYEKMPYYAYGLNMAYEYVTRAYETMYMVAHGMNLEEKLARLRDSEQEPFPYIENVYEMVYNYPTR